MKHKSLIIICFVYALVLSSSFAVNSQQPARAAQPFQTSVSKESHTRASLVASVRAIRPGTNFKVGVLLEMEPGWHTYYKEPGDAGMPTKIIWTLPSGFKTSELLWEKPRRFNEAGIITNGYQNKTLVAANITVPAHIHGPITIKALVKWLSCKDLCIPGQASLSLDLPITDAQPESSIYAKDFSKVGFKADVKTLPVIPLVSPVSSVSQTSPISQISQASSILNERLAVQGQKPLNLGGYMFFAFLGGLLLNFMPCVLPVIAIKLVSFLEQANDHPARVRLLGLTFASGIIASFLLLASGVVAIQMSGKNIGWGFLFQYPAFLIAMSVIVLLFSLSLFGLFYFSFSAGQAQVDKLASREGIAGTFFKGVLATMLSTPCTAPFLGTALGFAFTQSRITIFALFFTIGLGMALPYILLTARPEWMRYMPKPGAWMEKFKESIGFALLATVIWLLSVLGTISGMEVVIHTIAFLLSVAFASWIISSFTDLQSGSNKTIAIWGLALSVVAIAFYACYSTSFGALIGQSGQNQQLEQPRQINWQPYSITALDHALAKNKTVMIDFTADWCLTCQVNERTVLDSPLVVDKIKSLHAVTFKADWTTQSPEISALLAKFNRYGVPLYVIFPAGKPHNPIVLPEIITSSIVIDALNLAGASKI